MRGAPRHRIDKRVQIEGGMLSSKLQIPPCIAFSGQHLVRAKTTTSAFCLRCNSA